jgi:hypothetical protein
LDNEDTAPEFVEVPLKKHMSAPTQLGTSPQFRIHDHDHKAVVMETIREEYTPLDRSKVLADCVGSSIRGIPCGHDEHPQSKNFNVPLGTLYQKP